MIGEGRFELERAITQNELALHYQPIFDISGDALRGVEALVRWKHPQKGLVSPHAFLPTAEREGLMHALTAWVLREALLQAKVWRQDGLTLNMSVNIAASDLGDPRFLRLLDRTLHVTAGKSEFSAEIRADETADASAKGLRELRAREPAFHVVAVVVETDRRGQTVEPVGVHDRVPRRLDDLGVLESDPLVLLGEVAGRASDVGGPLGLARNAWDLEKVFEFLEPLVAGSFKEFFGRDHCHLS